jgi:tungstate transport system ATP-binding protein
VGLGERATDPARKLSGGEQQRLALARAWACEPELLLLDEPTANLDPGATDAIERLIGEFVRSGAKVILVSHNLGQVSRLAEDVLVLERGRVVEHGPAANVLHKPRSPEARAFIRGELPWTSFAAAC